MLTKDDEQRIEAIVQRIVGGVDGKLSSMEERIVARINREIQDLAEVNRLALDRLDNHESRIQKLETTAAHA